MLSNQPKLLMLFYINLRLNLKYPQSLRQKYQMSLFLRLCQKNRCLLKYLMNRPCHQRPKYHSSRRSRLYQTTHFLLKFLKNPLLPMFRFVLRFLRFLQCLKFRSIPMYL